VQSDAGVTERSVAYTLNFATDQCGIDGPQ
jgi:hypothetical protein